MKGSVAVAFFTGVLIVFIYHNFKSKFYSSLSWLTSTENVKQENKEQDNINNINNKTKHENFSSDHSFRPTEFSTNLRRLKLFYRDQNTNSDKYEEPTNNYKKIRTRSISFPIKHDNKPSLNFSQHKKNITKHFNIDDFKNRTKSGTPSEEHSFYDEPVAAMTQSLPGRSLIPIQNSCTFDADNWRSIFDGVYPVDIENQKEMISPQEQPLSRPDQCDGGFSS